MGHEECGFKKAEDTESDIERWRRGKTSTKCYFDSLKINREESLEKEVRDEANVDNGAKFLYEMQNR